MQAKVLPIMQLSEATLICLHDDGISIISDQIRGASPDFYCLGNREGDKNEKS